MASSGSVASNFGPGAGELCQSVRLGPVKGYADRANDVIWCGQKYVKAQQNIVYFGGDVQDYPENMVHPGNQKYEKWNLERTAQLIQHHFPSSHVWVVKPNEMMLRIISIFSNFVHFDDSGFPVHADRQHSWNHFKGLLESAVQKANSEITAINSCDQNGLECPSEVFSATIPLSVIGFSKGCVVLNQLLYELELARQDKVLAPFIDRIDKMYWLDGGHNGGSNTWIVHDKILSGLKGTNIEVNIHVTPYQVKDERRKWIGTEQKEFTHKLKKMGIRVKDYVHFAEEERSIDNHFKVLQVFAYF